MRPRYLIDKSALVRMPQESVRRRLSPLIEEGEVATCDIIELEVLYGARSREDYERTRLRRELAYPSIPITPAILRRALDVQGLLARAGHHRVAIPDLIIAAVAESAQLTILHYDRDYDVIAQVTGQAVEWVAARGSVP